MGLGVDLTGDLGQMQAHSRGVDMRQDQGRRLLGRRADGGEDVGGGIALVFGLAGPAAAPGPASAAPMLRLRSSGRVGAPEGRVSPPF